MSLLRNNLQLISIYALTCLKLPLFSYALTACFNATYLFAWSESIFNVISSLFSLSSKNLEYKSFNILRFAVKVLKEFYVPYLFYNYHFIQVLLIQAIIQLLKTAFNKNFRPLENIGRLSLFFIFDLSYVLLNYACVTINLSISEVLLSIFNLNFITFAILSFIDENNSSEQVSWLESNFLLNISKLAIFSYISFNSIIIKRSIKTLVYGTTVKLNPKSTDTLLVFIKLLLKTLPNWVLSQVIKYFITKQDEIYAEEVLVLQYRRNSARMIIESNLVDFKRQNNAFLAVTAYLKAIFKSNATSFSVGILLSELMYDIVYSALNLLTILNKK